MDLMETEEKTSMGLDVDVACIGCYLGGPFTGALMLWLEKRDLLVRFHAAQSCLLFGPPFVLIPAYFLLPSPTSPGARFIYYVFGGLLILGTIATFFLILPAAWRLERKRLPIIGRIADRWIPDDGRAEAYDLTGNDGATGASSDLAQLTFEAVPPAPGRPDTFVALMPKGVVDKADLLDQVAAALKFPDSLGRSWDALDEGLGRLDWIPEKRVILFHPELPLARHPQDRKTYVSCLSDAVAEWKSRPAKELVVVFPPSSRAELQRGQTPEIRRAKR
jgi:uncharacterized membrane protein